MGKKFVRFCWQIYFYLFVFDVFGLIWKLVFLRIDWYIIHALKNVYKLIGMQKCSSRTFPTWYTAGRVFNRYFLTYYSSFWSSNCAWYSARSSERYGNMGAKLQPLVIFLSKKVVWRNAFLCKANWSVHKNSFLKWFLGLKIENLLLGVLGIISTSIFYF